MPRRLETNQGLTEGFFMKTTSGLPVRHDLFPSLCSSKFLFVLPIISIKGYFQG